MCFSKTKSSPTYILKLADKRVDMLAKTAKDALIRADAIALQAGLQLELEV